MKLSALHLAFATIGCLAMGGASLAQQATEVTVEAPHVEKTTQPGAMGKRIPTLSIVYKVSYADLNLGTHSGAVELEKRIKESATKACDQLAKLYPETTETSSGCVQGAMKNAMAQASKAIATAEKSAKN
jgi:UrcA family protein